MEPFFAELWGNPSSMHFFGGQVAKHVEEGRANSPFIHADPSEIVFTSCGTESNNAAIYGSVEIQGPKTLLITSRVEHPAVLGACRHFREHGHRALKSA